MNNSSDKLNCPSDHPEHDRLLDELDATIYRMGRLMASNQGDFVRRNGLTAPQFMVLKMLMTEGPVRVSDIATNLGVKNPAASMLIQGLEEQGFVERSHDTEDHRVVLVRTTIKGEKQVASCEDSRRMYMRLFTVDLPPGDLETLVRILGTLADTVARKL